MEFFAVSVVKQLFLPPTVFLVALFFGLFRRNWWLSTACASFLWMFSLPVFVNTMASYWETYPKLSQQELVTFKPQAIVLIGGGLNRHASEYNQALTVNTRSMTRLRYAAKLVNETQLPILVSGGKLSEDALLSESAVMGLVLSEEFKVKVNWLEERSLNTAENARYSFQLLKSKGIQQIILVTQAYHMPRAMHEFKQAGFQVLSAPTDFLGGLPSLTLASWIPSAMSLHYSYLLTHEMLGMLWYRMRYST